jgi:putative ABC transport system substrate-binding protein
MPPSANESNDPLPFVPCETYIHLARPEVNITGLASFGEDIPAKRVQLLKEFVPRIARLAVILNPANPATAIMRERMRAATARLSLDYKTFEVRDARGQGVSSMVTAGADSIVVSSDTLFRSRDRELAALAAKYRFPSVGSIEYAEAGGLIGYGVNDAELFRRGAYFVD